MEENELLQSIIQEEMARRLRIWWDQELPMVQAVAEEVFTRNLKKRLTVHAALKEPRRVDTPETDSIADVIGATAVATGSPVQHAQFWTMVSDLVRYQRAMGAGNRAFTFFLPDFNYWQTWVDMKKGRVSLGKMPDYLRKLRKIVSTLDLEKPDWRKVPLPQGSGKEWPPVKLVALCYHVLILQGRLKLTHNVMIETYREFLGSKPNFQDMLNRAISPATVPAWIAKLEKLLLQHPGTLPLPV